MSNYDKFKLTDEDIRIGIDDFFTQLLIEERRRKNKIKSLIELASETPTIIFVAGQPGSGKTTLSKYIEAQYDERDEAVVEVGSDKIATFHRDYEDLVKLLPDECYKITRQFVRVAEPQIYKTMRDNKLNIIREISLNKGEADYEKMKEFRDSGYQVEIHVIAVDKYESFLSCIERDIKLLEIGYDPRPVARANHDRMYEPLIQELIEIGRRGLSTKINVYVRGESPTQPQIVWSSEGDDRYPNAQEAVVCERAKLRKRILQEPQQYLARIAEARRKILLMIQDERMKKNYLKELRQLESEFVGELALDRSVSD